jgi:hypothetical protein
MATNGWARLFVAVYGDGHQDDEHWALYIENVTLVQAMSLRRWYVDVRNRNPRDSGSYRGMIYLTDVRTADVPEIEEIAPGLRLNRYTGWNCQDFVMDLLAALEDEAIIDPNDNEYQEQKDRLRALLHRRT